MEELNKILEDKEELDRILGDLDEIASNGMPVIRDILRQQGVEEVKYYLLEATGWHDNFDPYVLGDDASEEQKRIGWAMALKIKKIISKALYEEHRRLEEEIRQFASEGPEVFYQECRE